MSLLWRRILTHWLVALGLAMLVFPYSVYSYRTAGEIDYLREVLWVLGVITLLMGLLQVRKLYPSLPGLPVNSRKVAIIYDVCLLLLSVPSAYMALCWLLKSTLGVRPLLDEDEILLLGTFFFLFSIPFVSSFTDRFTSQSIQVDDEAITLHQSATITRLDWKDLQEIDLSSENVWVGRAGVATQRTVQRRLVLTAADGHVMIIHEPQLAKRKKEVLDLLEKHAPGTATEALAVLRSEW